jgi:ABC-type dipeptide/oligopeptide/nickel transport system permease component
MQGIFLIITISVLVANLLADVAYLVPGPRAPAGRRDQWRSPPAASTP